MHMSTQGKQVSGCSACEQEETFLLNDQKLLSAKRMLQYPPKNL